jgi:serine/threonine protein phosphatase 1
LIVIITDIHGLLDPLKYLLTELENSYICSKRKFIFLGDYVDYGPNSKEVIDLLLSIKDEKIFLAGNHDDALLQFFIKENRDDNFTEEYWKRDLDGYRTLVSFLGIEQANRFHNPEERAKFKLKPKYMNFFKSLKYLHVEKIANQDFIFSHSCVDDNPKISIDTFLNLDTYQKYYDFINKTNMSVAKLQLWNRKDCHYKTKEEEFKKIRDYVVVHGHTVVAAIKDIPKLVLENKLPLVEADKDYKIIQTEKALYINDRDAYKLNVSLKDIYGINIDTGAAYSQALTAMIIDKNDLSSIDFIQVRMSRPNKNKANIERFTYYFD